MVEGVLVGIDVGTSKVCALIGEGSERAQSIAGVTANRVAHR